MQAIPFLKGARCLPRIISHRADFCPAPCLGRLPLKLAGSGARESSGRLSESVLAGAVSPQQTVVREP